MPPPASTISSTGSPISPRVPISPFSLSPDGDGDSVSTSSSHYTSDDQPDLGAFGTIFREWGYLQPPLRIPHYNAVPHAHAQGNYYQETTTSMSVSGSASGVEETTEEADTGVAGMSPGRHSTVWNQDLIAHYLRSSMGNGSGGVTVTTPTTAMGATPTTATANTSTALSLADLYRNSTLPSARTETASILVSIDPGTDTGADTDTDDTEGARSVIIETVGSSHNTDLEDDIIDDASSSALLKPVIEEMSTTTNYDMFSTLRTQPSFSLLTSGTVSTRDVELDVAVELESDSHVAFDDLTQTRTGDEPSLGYLDQALSFLVAERLKLGAQRAAGAGSSSPIAWKHIIDPHRKRRRKKTVKTGSSTITSSTSMTSATLTAATLPAPVPTPGGSGSSIKSVSEGDGDEDDDDDGGQADYSSAAPLAISSSSKRVKMKTKARSTPGTPHPLLISRMLPARLLMSDSGSGDSSGAGNGADAGAAITAILSPNVRTRGERGKVALPISNTSEGVNHVR